MFKNNASSNKQTDDMTSHFKYTKYIFVQKFQPTKMLNKYLVSIVVKERTRLVLNAQPPF